MLGIIGNINHIRDSEIHACVFKHLIELWQMLEMVTHNLLRFFSNGSVFYTIYTTL